MADAPRCAQTMESAMPVLPEVASTTVMPGLSAPLIMETDVNSGARCQRMAAAKQVANACEGRNQRGASRGLPMSQDARGGGVSW